MPPFTPRTGIRIAENDAALQAQQAQMDSSYDSERVTNIVDELKALGKPTFTITPIEFEKDDDSNLHMDFIVAASNLRASNYNIPPADKHKVSLAHSSLILFVNWKISWFVVEIDRWKNHPSHCHNHCDGVRMCRSRTLQTRSRVSFTQKKIEDHFLPISLQLHQNRSL